MDQTAAQRPVTVAQAAVDEMMAAQTLVPAAQEIRLLHRHRKAITVVQVGQKAVMVLAVVVEAQALLGVMRLQTLGQMAVLVQLLLSQGRQ